MNKNERQNENIRDLFIHGFKQILKFNRKPRFQDLKKQLQPVIDEVEFQRLLRMISQFEVRNSTSEALMVQQSLLKVLRYTWEENKMITLNNFLIEFTSLPSVPTDLALIIQEDDNYLKEMSTEKYRFGSRTCFNELTIKYPASKLIYEDFQSSFMMYFDTVSRSYSSV